MAAILTAFLVWVVIAVAEVCTASCSSGSLTAASATITPAK
jgi:hypothetical protein